MDTTTGLRLANNSPDVVAFSERNATTSGDPTGPANSLGTPLNNVEHFRHHRSSDEKLSLEKREAALVQITGLRPIAIPGIGSPWWSADGRPRRGGRFGETGIH